jgi:cysteine desulfurase
MGGRSLDAVHDGYTYLDHAATTPMRADAVTAMMPFLTEQFANPSGSHRFARQVRKLIDEARDDVADVLGCRPGEVIFTSGGTEADNTAIFGTLDRCGGSALCPAVEHHAVLQPVEARRGRVIGVDATGRIDLDALASALADDAKRSSSDRVSIVSVMAVNNEVGTITDIADVAAVVNRFAPTAALHTDAVQAACWLDLRTITPHVDLMSLSAHKFGGPKGTGVLVARGRSSFAPLLVGGGQERERRSGTHNVAGIIAMAVALRATDSERAVENTRVAALRDALVDGLRAELDGIHETVDRPHKVAGSAHVCIDGIENEALLYLLDEGGVCASAAAACASGAMEPSHVLAAMGVPNERARGALRLTLGRTTTAADITRATTAIVESVRRLRRGQAECVTQGRASCLRQGPASCLRQRRES